MIPAPAARAAEDKKAAEEEKEKVEEAPKAAPFSFLGAAKKVYFIFLHYTCVRVRETRRKPKEALHTVWMGKC